MDRCPHCKSDAGFEYRDYGVTIVYTGLWGAGIKGVECSDYEHDRPAPVYCKCVNCGKRTKIKDAR